MITTTCWILWIPTRLGVGGWLASAHVDATTHASSAPVAVAATRQTRTRSLRILGSMAVVAGCAGSGGRDFHLRGGGFAGTRTDPGRGVPGSFRLCSGRKGGGP